MSTIDINVETYSGPFDLLLDLIRKNKIDIYDIPINEITSQYLEYLSKASALNIEIRVEFLYLAATLINIKTKMLLPKNVDDDENLQSDLVEQLILYSKFKFQSEVLRKIYNKNKLSFSRYTDLNAFDIGTDFKIVGSTYRLNSSITRLLTGAIEDENADSQTVIFKDKYKVENLAQSIIDNINKLSKLDFSKVVNKKEKNFIITAFLAVLELLNQGKINFYQEENFSDIYLEKK